MIQHEVFKYNKYKLKKKLARQILPIYNWNRESYSVMISFVKSFELIDFVMRLRLISAVFLISRGFMDKKIKALEKKTKELVKGEKMLLKADKKNDKVVAKAKMKMKGKC